MIEDATWDAIEVLAQQAGIRSVEVTVRRGGVLLSYAIYGGIRREEAWPTQEAVASRLLRLVGSAIARDPNQMRKARGRAVDHEPIYDYCDSPAFHEDNRPWSREDQAKEMAMFWYKFQQKHGTPDGRRSSLEFLLYRRVAQFR